MKPLTLEEFAQELRRKGDFREVEFADEILALIDLEEEVAEPYGNLCADLDIYAKSELEGKPEKQLEWLGDRSNLLAEIEKHFADAGIAGDVDDLVRQMIAELPEETEYDL